MSDACERSLRARSRGNHWIFCILLQKDGMKLCHSKMYCTRTQYWKMENVDAPWGSSISASVHNAVDSTNKQRQRYSVSFFNKNLFVRPFISFAVPHCSTYSALGARIFVCCYFEQASFCISD